MKRKRGNCPHCGGSGWTGLLMGLGYCAPCESTGWSNWDKYHPEAYECADCGFKSWGAWNCDQCGKHNLIRW
jgi:hypothetical protein